MALEPHVQAPGSESDALALTSKAALVTVARGPCWRTGQCLAWREKLVSEPKGIGYVNLRDVRRAFCMRHMVSHPTENLVGSRRSAP